MGKQKKLTAEKITLPHNHSVKNHTIKQLCHLKVATLTTKRATLPFKTSTLQSKRATLNKKGHYAIKKDWYSGLILSLFIEKRLTKI